jgi:hypothetical protein
VASNGWTVRQSSELARGRKRTAPHAWKNIKGFRFPWPVCARCGLILLKNQATRLAAKRACEVWDDE